MVTRGRGYHGGMRMSCDVLIVGGGLVGASLALALTRGGVAVTMVEARPATTALADPARERYLALARGSVDALRALGAWAGLDEHAAAIRAVHISRRGDFGRVLLRAEDYDVDRFGAVVPASRLGLALEAALQRAPGLTRLMPATLRGFDGGPDRVEAHIDTDGEARTLHAQLLVGADGADSFVRAHAGLQAERDDYGQDALVLSLGVTRDHGDVAYERFTPDGAVAALPLPERRVGMVWTLPRASAEAIASSPEHERLGTLQAVFGHRLGRLHAPGRLVRYPLVRTFAPQTVRDRVVLVGNAAQSLHPIAAQGFNLGLRDALVLAEELARPALRPASAAFAEVPNMLRRHAGRRRRDRERIAALSHRLARWPKVDAPGLGLLRSFAFGAFNALPAARESLVLAAMGYAEDVPALLMRPAA